MRLWRLFRCTWLVRRNQCEWNPHSNTNSRLPRSNRLSLFPAREARGITKCVGSNPVNVRASVRACVRTYVRAHYSGRDLWFFGGFWLFRVPVLVAIHDFWNQLYIVHRHFCESSWRGGENLRKIADLNVIVAVFGSFLCPKHGSWSVGFWPSLHAEP